MVPRTFLFIFLAGSCRLGSNNFRNTSYKEKKRPVRPVFPDYLSVSYDYGLGKYELGQLNYFSTTTLQRRNNFQTQLYESYSWLISYLQKGCYDFKLNCDSETETICKSIQINTRQYLRKMIQSWESKKLLLVTGSFGEVKLFGGLFRTLLNVSDAAFSKNS